jgi:hypothetical protein
MRTRKSLPKDASLGPELQPTHKRPKEPEYVNIKKANSQLIQDHTVMSLLSGMCHYFRSILVVRVDERSNHMVCTPHTPPLGRKPLRHV